MASKPKKIKEIKSDTIDRKGLLEKPYRFCLAYAGEAKFNATKAAKIARYNGDNTSLGVIGHNLLRNVKIANFIKELTEQKLKDAGYQVDRVTKEIIDCAFSDPADFFEADKDGYLKFRGDLENLPTNVLKSIKIKNQITRFIGRGKNKKEFESWVTEVTFHDKEWALGMLSKLLGMESGEEWGKKTRQTFADFIKAHYLGKTK